MTSKYMLEEGFYYLSLLKEDSYHMCAANLHELLRAWEIFTVLLLERRTHATFISVKKLVIQVITTEETTWLLTMKTGNVL